MAIKSLYIHSSKIQNMPFRFILVKFCNDSVVDMLRHSLIVVSLLSHLFFNAQWQFHRLVYDTLHSFSSVLLICIF